MRHTLRAALLSAVASVAMAGGATATTLTFSNFVSSNGSDRLFPTVSIDNSTANQFAVTIDLASGESGTLGGVFFDIGDPVTNVGGTSYTPVTPSSSANTTFFASDSGFDTKSVNTGECTNNTNLNGFGGSLPMFEMAVCYKSTGSPSGRPTNGLTSVSFIIVDADGNLTLDQFLGIGLRYQQASNGAGSDKLFAARPDAPPPVEVVPLPAAGWLLLAGVGGLAAWGRRRRIAA